jgi:hypothetical protein
MLAHKGVGPPLPGFGFSRGTTLLGRLPKCTDAVPGLAWLTYRLAQPAQTSRQQTYLWRAPAPALEGATRVAIPGTKDSGSKRNKNTE